MSSWTAPIIRRAPLLIELGFLLWMLVSSSTVTPFFFSASLFLIFAGAALDLAARIETSRSTRILGRIGGTALALTLVNFFAHPITHASATRCLELSAFIVGVACLHADDGPYREGRLARFVSLAVLLVVFGLAQRLYLFELLRRDALAVRPDILDGERGLFFKSPRARSTFGQANAFAGFLVLLLPTAIFAALSRSRARLAGIVLLVLLSCGLWASGSKGGGATAMLFSGLALRSAIDRSMRSLRAVSWVLFAAVLTGACLVGADLAGASLPKSAAGISATLELRFGYWRAAFAIFKDHPLIGVGLGEFGDFALEHFDRTGSGSRRAHSFLFTMLAEGGLIGIGLIATAIAAFVFVERTRDDRAASDDPPTRTIDPRPWKDFLPMAILIGVASLAAGPSDIDLYFWPLKNTRLFDLLGAAISVAVAAIAFRLIARPIAAAFKDRSASAVAAIKFGILGIATHALIDFDFEVVGCLGALAVAASLLPVSRSPRESLGPTERRIAGLGAVLLFLTTFLWALRALHAHEFRAFWFEEKMIRGTLLSAQRSQEVLADWENESRRFAPDTEIAASFIDRAILSADRDAISRAEAVVADLDSRLLHREPLARRKAALDFISERRSDDPRVWRAAIEAAVTRFAIGR